MKISWEIIRSKKLSGKKSWHFDASVTNLFLVRCIFYFLQKKDLVKNKKEEKGVLKLKRVFAFKLEWNKPLLGSKGPGLKVDTKGKSSKGPYS